MALGQTTPVAEILCNTSDAHFNIRLKVKFVSKPVECVWKYRHDSKREILSVQEDILYLVRSTMRADFHPSSLKQLYIKRALSSMG